MGIQKVYGDFFIRGIEKVLAFFFEDIYDYRMGRRPKINVFDYIDYRKFLKDFYNYKKTYSYGFSFRAFSQSAGLRSTNYLKLVTEGARNLTAEMAGRFAKACELYKEEADYFCELVEFNQARTARERERYYRRLSAFKKFRRIHRLEASQTEYHSTWYLPAIRELAARKDFTGDPRWIAGMLRPKITAYQAKKALDTLVRLGLLEKEGRGKLRQTKKIVTTGEGPLSHYVVSYHLAMMERAAEALEKLPREQREISSLTLCVSEKTLQELKERIGQFRREILREAELKGRPEQVVQINFQLFPLSRGK